MEKVVIDGVTYVPETELAKKTDGLEYCIIRTYSAGVHAGYVESRDGKEIVLRHSRRLWKWAGAFTLSELSRVGTTDAGNCKFACTIERIILTEAIEIIPCTETSRNIIEGVKDYEC